MELEPTGVELVAWSDEWLSEISGGYTKNLGVDAIR